MSQHTRRVFLKTTVSTLSLAGAPASMFSSLGSAAETSESENSVQVACYYFPNYHLGDPQNEKLKGKGWSEWELVKAAKPRFPGHRQPRVPLWGYTDESNPKDMAQKIDAAADHGIDAFIFDWYYFEDGLFLERGLEKGFFGAANNRRLKFALMWANHDWSDIHPCKLDAPPRLLYPGRISPKTFDKMTDYVIATYFQHPGYWLINGCPYFSFYNLKTLLEDFGSIEATRTALDHFRAKTKAAGFPELHLNAIFSEQPILPREQEPVKPYELVKQLGFNSVTSYNWVCHVRLPDFPATDYQYVFQKYEEYWQRARKALNIPYYPNVTMGWDASPRVNQADPFVQREYPFMATISNNTPKRFKAALETMKQHLQQQPANQRILTINCWNEWTEGSYLEPDTVHGTGYLNALGEVFGE